MRSMLLGVAMVAVSASAAWAQAPGQVAPPPTDAVVTKAAKPDRAGEVAIAVNSPVSWLGGFSYGGSVYVSVTPKIVLRGNVAGYKFTSSELGDAISIASGGDGDEAYRSGWIVDGSVGAMFFPRKLWSGPTVEIAALYRHRDTHINDEFATPAIEDRTTSTYAGRALVGWSWLFHDRAFIAIAVGASYGYERGTSATQEYDYAPGQMTTVHRVHGAASSGEGYLRLGFTFGR